MIGLFCLVYLFFRQIQWFKLSTQPHRYKMRIIGLILEILQFHGIFVHLEVLKTNCLPTEVTVTTRIYNSKTHFVSKTFCKETCPGNQYVFQEKCFDNCPILTFKQDNGFIKYCINSPNRNLECLKAMCNQQLLYCFNGYCLNYCPEYTVDFNKTCLMHCPDEAPYMTAYSCDGVCYSGKKSCSVTCPNSHPFVFHSRDIKHCLRECPDFTAVNGYSCDTVCPHGLPLLFNRSCTKECPTTSPLMYLKTSSFNRIWVCTTKCQSNMASFKNVCVSVCPNNTYLDSVKKECVEKCDILRPYINANPALKSSIYHQQCLSRCPAEKYVLSLNNISHCIVECPKNFSLFNYTCLSQCPESHPYKSIMSVKDNKTFSCVEYCEENEFLYNDTCYSQCPADLVHYLSTCVEQCYGSFPFLYKHNRTCVGKCSEGHVLNRNICDGKCPEDLFHVENGICSSNCSKNTSFYIVSDVGKVCIYSESCPKETVLLENTKECIQKCPMKTHIVIDNVCSKVEKCPNSYFVTLDPMYGYRCTTKCPISYFSNGRKCVRWCPQNMVIVDGTCVNNCTSTKPYGLRNESLNGTVCYSVCPDTYVNYLNKCISHSMCLFGKKFYIYENTCYQNCPSHTFISEINTYFVCENINNTPSAVDLSTFGFIGVSCTLLFYLICCFQGLPRCLFRDCAGFGKVSATETRNLIAAVDNNGIEIDDVENQ
ncbi:proprotein convertase subtilisin/kexin type 5-like [Saccostrea echinata]|uniref:proprotein convertase subtilisin/kexin type 5-like n=1 Tax=Saccostrea echinata TaxID=191078 RepID=UPI002A8088E8|nr:proprotein convertase subtilisin/kexin type 5-like [Saccostrea echinata]